MSRRPTPGAQLSLDFPRLDPAQRPLIETAPYADALVSMRRWRDWPEGQLAIIGEARCGRTRLLRAWSIETGAALVTGQALAAADMDEISQLAISALAIDDADAGAAGLGLLAALNLCRARRAPVLVSGRGQPAGWHVEPPDLRSRLAALPVAVIDVPDGETLGLRLAEECARRHLNVPLASIAYLADRMPRFWSSVDEFADAIERIRGKAYTLRSARAVAAFLGHDSGE